MRRRLPIGAPGRWRDGHATRVTREATETARRTLRQAIADSLAERLSDMDIATSELAAALGVSNAAVKAWCRGSEIPSLMRLVTIALALRCPLLDLIPPLSHDDIIARPTAPMTSTREPRDHDQTAHSL